MLLSEIVKLMPTEYDYKVYSDVEFDILGLIQSDASKDMCTFLDDDHFTGLIPKNAKMIITTQELYEKIKDNISAGVCITCNPRFLYFSIHNLLSRRKEFNYNRSTFKTIIGEQCNISKHCCISDHNVIIGENVTIEEFVSIKENTTIGNNCIIRAGAVIGGEGFEFKANGEDVLSVKHLGGVRIGENVEIQNNTCIDKAVYPWDNTTIGDNSKIDNLVYIAHGVKISKNVLIVGQSGILGRTVVESNSKIGMGASIKNAVHIGKASVVSIGSVVTQNVKPDEKVTGNFAIEHKRFIEHIKAIR